MKKLHTIRLIAFITSLALLALLIAFQLLPLTFNEGDWLAQVASQSTRAQRIAKNALILGYRPDNERAQAVSEIQNSLPLWEAQQAKLQSLRNTDLKALVAQSQPDFVSMDTAARKILAHPKERADVVQVDIIMQHERNYSIVMGQITTLLQQYIKDINLRLALWQNGIVVLLLVTIILHFMFAEREQKRLIKSKEG